MEVLIFSGYYTVPSLNSDSYTTRIQVHYLTGGSKFNVTTIKKDLKKIIITGTNTENKDNNDLLHVVSIHQSLATKGIKCVIAIIPSRNERKSRGNFLLNKIRNHSP